MMIQPKIFKYIPINYGYLKVIKLKKNILNSYFMCIL